MAKRRKNTGFVFVDKAWFNQTLRGLFGLDRTETLENVHLMIGEIEVNEALGVWLKDTKTSVLRKDGAEVKMDFLVPWRFVVGVGLSEDDAIPSRVGFVGNEHVTILK
jgi:hypothetical protein